jgi:hypothetical protein
MNHLKPEQIQAAVQMPVRDFAALAVEEVT